METCAGQLITVTRRGCAAVVTLNRPEKRNALSLEMRARFVEAMRKALADAQCSAVILTGAGSAFCSGADLKEVSGELQTNEQRSHRMALLQAMVREIVNCPKPVIAAVRGSVYGAGLSLATACDRIIASETSQFSAVFARVGLCPDAGIMWTLPARVGEAQARRLLLTGDSVGGREALTMGLIDELVDDASLLAAAEAFAQSCSYAAPLAVAAIKHGLTAKRTSLEAVFEYEAEMQLILGATEDTAEARAAFFAKRAPNFVGR